MEIRRFFINSEQALQGEQSGTINIVGSDVKHITQVLRMQQGDELLLCATDGRAFVCVIDSTGEGGVISCRVTDIRRENNEPRMRVTLIQGLPKGDKTEHIIQKSVELGVSSVIIAVMQRTIVRFKDDKAKESKRSRWQKIAEEASKQCGRSIVPHVSMPVSLEEAVMMIPDGALRIMAYENEHEVTLKNLINRCTQSEQYSDSHDYTAIRDIVIAVGPEGGFAQEEADMLVNKYGFNSVTLGRIILRTETAGPSLLAMLQYAFEQ